MDVYFLYRDENDAAHLAPLLDRLNGAHGTDLPHRLHSRTTVLQWGCREQAARRENEARRAQAARSEQEARSNKNALNLFAWMNPNESLALLGDMWTSEQMLACHGVTSLRSMQHKSGEPRSRSMQRYRVFVFNLRPIALYKGIAALEINLDQRSQRHLIREAIRALYVLGLDFAEVELTMHRNKWAVVHIDPTPFLTEHTAKRWAEAIRTYRDEHRMSANEIEDQLLLGSDSEFVLRRQQDGKIVMADRYFNKKGAVGCDGLRLTGKRIIFPFVELRPEPVKEPTEAIRAIRRTMLLAAKKVGDQPFEWVAGGMPVKGLAAGGHIHFSGIPLRSDIIRVLDHYLALPMVMIETVNERDRRPKFGFIGDYRLKEYGGFEYRTLPSWLVSPRITKAVFTLARYLVLHADELRQRPLMQLQTLIAFYNGEKEKLLPLVRSIWNELSKKKSFSVIREDAAPLFHQAIEMKPWAQNEDFRNSWKVASNVFVPIVRQ